MGFPIRSNIFVQGSESQRYFNSFPIQVAVLFSPTDTDFTETFRDIFLHLDRITGDRLAFFAVLDPPEDWQEEAKTRTWWRDQQQRFGQLGFSFDKKPLVNEIARRFGVEWWEMPAIVVSSNLWAAEYLITPTSASLIEDQLTRLTTLAQLWGRPNINHIGNLLEYDLGLEVRHFSSNFAQRDSLYEFYDVLGNYDPHSNRILDQRQFENQVSQALRSVRGPSNSLQFSRNRNQRSNQEQRDVFEGEDNILFEQAATEAAGRIVPVATVAERVFNRLNEPTNQELVTALDETSKAMIETSLTVGNFVEAVQRNLIPGLKVLRFADRDRNSNRMALDYSVGAVGVWKAIELETNMSLIQAGRCTLGITMPSYFMEYAPDFPQENAIVITGIHNNGDPIRVDLNLLDRQHRPRHTLLTLGRGWHLIQTMLKDETEGLSNLIRELTGNSLPNIVMETWQAIRPIRNKASHANSINEEEYKKVVRMGLNSKFLTPLMTIKTRLQSER